MQQNQPTTPQAEESAPTAADAFSLDDDTPLDRPAEGAACSLEPGCESCQ